MFSLDYLFLRNKDGVLLFNIMPQTFYTLPIFLALLFYFILFCNVNCGIMIVTNFQLK